MKPRRSPIWLKAGLIGLAGSAAIALGRLPALLQIRSLPGRAWAQQLTDALGGPGIAGSASVLGVSLLILAWVSARKADGNTDQIWIFLLWAAPLLLIDGFNSNDARIYVEQGWTLNQGLNPYQVGLCQPEAPLHVDGGWCGTTAVYPPLALRLFQLVGLTFGSHPLLSILGMRILALAGVALLWWSLLRMADGSGVSRRFAIWLAILNPVTILQGVAGMHIDMLMVGVTAMALMLASTRAGFLLAAVLAGVAASIKQPALLAAVPIGWLPVNPLRGFLRSAGRALLAVAIAVTSFLGVGFVTGLGTGWTAGSAAPFKYDTLGPGELLTWTVDLVNAVAGTSWNVGSSASLRTFTLVAGIVLILVLAIRYYREPYQFMTAATLTWVATGGAFREWYLLLWIAFLPLAPLGRAMRVAASILIPLTSVYLPLDLGLRMADKIAFAIALGVALVANVPQLLVPEPPPRAKRAVQSD